ncbi:hypothetical protein [Klebsiella oxytoca]|uniref:hypothetical protein n=1 Tax=Klebsiella oxytoca TaxID=571 RepID=UPI00157A4CC5|nr:hypothetical protein [Klebsiella oxytoca]
MPDTKSALQAMYERMVRNGVTLTEEELTHFEKNGVDIGAISRKGSGSSSSTSGNESALSKADRENKEVMNTQAKRLSDQLSELSVQLDANAKAHGELQSGNHRLDVEEDGEDEYSDSDTMSYSVPYEVGLSKDNKPNRKLSNVPTGSAGDAFIAKANKKQPNRLVAAGKGKAGNFYGVN